jgi:hypothetical protein
MICAAVQHPWKFTATLEYTLEHSNPSVNFLGLYSQFFPAQSETSNQNILFSCH